MFSWLGSFFATSLMDISVYDILVLFIFVASLVLTIIFSLIIIATKVRKLNNDLQDQSNSQIASHKAILDNLEIIVSHIKNIENSPSPSPVKRSANKHISQKNEVISENVRFATEEDSAKYHESNAQDDGNHYNNQKPNKVIDNHDYVEHDDKNEVNNDNVTINTQHEVIEDSKFLNKPKDYKLPSMALNIIHDEENNKNASATIPPVNNIVVNPSNIDANVTPPLRLPAPQNMYNYPNSNYTGEGNYQQNQLASPLAKATSPDNSFKPIQVPSIDSFVNNSGTNVNNRIEELRSRLQAVKNANQSSVSRFNNIKASNSSTFANIGNLPRPSTNGIRDRIANKGQNTISSRFNNQQTGKPFLQQSSNPTIGRLANINNNRLNNLISGSSNRLPLSKRDTEGQNNARVISNPRLKTSTNIRARESNASNRQNVLDRPVNNVRSSANSRSNSRLSARNNAGATSRLFSNRNKNSNSLSLRDSSTQSTASNRRPLRPESSPVRSSSNRSSSVGSNERSISSASSTSTNNRREREVSTRRSSGVSGLASRSARPRMARSSRESNRR